MIVSAKENLSPANIAHLRKVLAEVSSFFDGERLAPEPSAVDAAWMVLEAANDLDDGATVEAAVASSTPALTAR